ncbi:zinc-dependent metalloprotease [Chitinophaga nivalis]|uniref:Zinc-dependent metalloprotease n=1 Tax=Chitinophaga nivalis TaxID=2991709 RepID=A0ABT3IE93_9BACT|nr:zinc-dependent metalloprotease [Chitinophaga nivalis]MCW3468044.1 zinc-dependent metalloprotease [Chitinophaga nivalis]MCW3482265.1 zinc-dependent metalloprotease [Chitinophaga nivalis]
MSKPFHNKLMIAMAGALCLGTTIGMPANAQRKKNAGTPAPSTAAAKDSTGKPPMIKPGPKAGPKSFGEVINEKAKADSGLFNIYKQDDRFFFEIPDSLLGRDVLVVNRISKSAAGLRAQMMGFSGDIIGENVIRFERGPNNRIFLKNISYSDVSKDSTQPMFTAVMNSNLQPISAAFDIKAFSKENKGSIIDLTEYISGDNDVLFFDGMIKNMLKLGGLQPDKSYISDVRSYPVNTEIKTVKTYSRSGGPGMPGMPPAPGGNATVELNSSMVLLPAVPMQPRYFDPRVGFFTAGVTDFDADPQGVKRLQMITRWRLEPKAEDVEKYKRGELVEPKKQIVFYIDPATPTKWRKYLIMGVNDWQTAFEQAGFKNAIVAKMAPTPAEDSTWSIDDARFSAIVYKPSEVPNASGPHVHDPRSGEILESHINWYHNVMRLLRNWYFVQAAPNDTRARNMQFSDELMGELIRFVSSHEVGHTLGLRHNFGSSSTYPVEKLRDKEWVKANGHAASIMDYARFNYVAQPGDGISGADLYPRINFYDKWAIEWGYKLLPEAKSAEAEKSTLNKWVVDKLKDKKYWFGTESNPDDPRSQSEDLGDNAMKASGYGIKNLQRILPNLLTWTKVEQEGYASLGELYKEIAGQFSRYMGHVVKNVGGIYETPKTVEQEGGVYEYVPKATQKEAIQFLNQQLFTTPKWLINQDILSRIGGDAPSIILTRQESILDRLMSAQTLNKLVNGETALGTAAYPATEMLQDLKKGIFTELTTHQPIDVYRRNLQRAYVDNLSELVTPAPAANPAMGGGGGNLAARTDGASIGRAQLTALRTELRAAISTDAMTRNHLQDLIARINKALDPK